MRPKFVASLLPVACLPLEPESVNQNILPTRVICLFVCVSVGKFVCLDELSITHTHTKSSTFTSVYKFDKFKEIHKDQIDDKNEISNKMAGIRIGLNFDKYYNIKIFLTYRKQKYFIELFIFD